MSASLQRRRAAVLAACALGSRLLFGLAHAGEASSASAAVEIRNFMFMPTTLTVSVGSSVSWTNRDDEVHTVVSEAGLFRSSALDTGQTFSYTFAKPGRYRIWCSLHPQMSAWVVVQ